MTTYGRTNAVTAGGGTPTPTQTKEVQATAFPTVVTPDEGYALSQATVTAPANLSAENIKKDVTIAGVTGSYEGSGTQENKVGQLVSKTITAVTLDDLKGVTSIGSYAFYLCKNLVSIELPSELTEIKTHAFENCINLTAITIPSGVTEIKDRTFSTCQKLASVTLSENLSTIGEGAFIYNYELTSITFPETITSIGSMAFYQCEKLSSIIMKGSTPPTLSGSSVFYMTASNMVITVPKGSLEAYQTATNWVAYADYMREATQ